MEKEIVEVKVILSSEERVLRIQSHPNEQGDTSFSVSSGSETFGTLYKSNIGWEWADGVRSQEEAQVIGSEIDANLINKA